MKDYPYQVETRKQGKITIHAQAYVKSSLSALNFYHNLRVFLSFPTNWSIFAGTKSGTGKLQVRHAAQSDAGIAGMAATTFGRHAHHRSNAGTQVANYQQSGLGKSVSWNWKLRIANAHDRRDSTITDNGTCPIESLVESKCRVCLTDFNRILNGIYWTITNFLLSLLLASLFDSLRNGHHADYDRTSLVCFRPMDTGYENEQSGTNRFFI